MIMNAIKGGGPLDQAVAQAIKGRASLRRRSRKGGIVPQSYTPQPANQGRYCPRPDRAPSRAARTNG